MHRRITIVGNGEVRAEDSAAIDAADFVIRFNNCGSYGHGGTRTDAVAVCNTGAPARQMLGSPQWLRHPAVAAATQIWMVRDPAWFAVLRPVLAVSRPDLGDFCDDYTDQFAAFCATFGKTHVAIGRGVHESVDDALSAFGPAPYVVPSSGMIVIAHVLEKFPASAVTVAGFGHVGWEGHPFSAERRLVDSHVAEGRLGRLGPAPIPASLLGA